MLVLRIESFNVYKRGIQKKEISSKIGRFFLIQNDKSSFYGNSIFLVAKIMLFLVLRVITLVLFVPCIVLLFRDGDVLRLCLGFRFGFHGYSLFWDFIFFSAYYVSWMMKALKAIRYVQTA